MKLPFTICIYVLSNEKLIEPLRLFIKFKIKTKTGRMLIPYLTRTEKKHFKTLQSEKWLNIKNEVIFLRKLSTIARYYKLKAKAASRILSNHLKDRNTFTGYLTAIALLAINKKNKWKRKKGTLAAVSGRGNSICSPLLPKISYSNAVSVRYLAKYLGVSIGKANKLKQLALQYKFIKVRRKVREFEFYNEGKLISPTKEQLPAVYFDYPQMFGRVFLKDGQLFYRQPDQIFTKI